MGRAIGRGFIKSKHRQLLKVAASPEELLNVLQHHQAMPPEGRGIEKVD
jgi:hypothetical protein